MGANDRIEPVVMASSPDAVTFAWGQSIESRYSSSQPLANLGNVVLALLRRRKTRDDAVKLPQFPVIVLCPDRIDLYDQATLLKSAKGGGGSVDRLAGLPRDSIEVKVQSGLMWKRIDMIDERAGSSYTVFLNRFTSRRVGEVTRRLRESPAPAQAAFGS